MSATAPEQEQKGFTADDFLDTITFEISFKNLYKDRKFEFCLQAETEDHRTALRELFAGRKVSSHQYNVERLARLLDAVPVGIADFPQGNLEKAAREYFTPKKFTRFVEELLLRYDTIQTSDQRFIL